MKVSFKVSLLALFLSFSQASVAYEVSQDILLKRSDIKRIKILSSETDSIVLFVTDNQKHKYRIAYMPKEEVDKIFNRLKNEGEITLRSRAVDKKDYREVVAWK